MSQIEFQALCSAWYAVYEPLIKIWCGAFVGVSVLASVVLGLVQAIRRVFY